MTFNLITEKIVSKADSCPGSTATSGQVDIGRTPSLPTLPYTGERMTPGQVAEPLFLEHEARYVFAGSFVKGKSVLDVACGVGIGTHYLSMAGAKSCMGMDIDGPTVEDARTTYKGCRFEQCDATDLSVADSSVDVVVSFETIEHLAHQRKFLSECYRVLKPAGMLICSTPNRTMTRWTPANPYHLKELTAAEFRCALEAWFVDIKLFGQESANQFSFAGKRLLSRALHALRIMNSAKKVMGWKFPPAATRSVYGGVPLDPRYQVLPYRPSLVVHPLYLIAVARKLS